MSSFRRAPGFVAAFVLGCIFATLLMGGQSIGQTPPVPSKLLPACAPTVGRYAVATTTTVQGQTYTVIIDTSTAEGWYTNDHRRWLSLPAPSDLSTAYRAFPNDRHERD
jgi:hypothetical protein